MGDAEKIFTDIPSIPKPHIIALRHKCPRNKIWKNLNFFDNFAYVKSGSPTHLTLGAPKSQSVALCPDFNLEYFWPYRLNCSRSIFVLACIDKGVIVKTKMYTLWCIISGNSYDLAMVMMAMIGVWRFPIPLWPFILQGKEPAIFVPRRKVYFAGFWKISEMIDINYWVCAGHNNVTCLALEWFMYIYWIWS